ncbi:MAG: hypothetical protein ACRCX9_11715 [Plesiomonas shigelloides]
MYWVDNGTGVTTPPTIPPIQSLVRQYFTEGGQGLQPTIPGGEWFNMVTDELISVLTASGISPVKGQHNQVITALKALIIDIIDIAVPVGIPFSWPLAELPPSKYGITFIKSNGAAFSEAQFPKLAKVYPSLRVPDLRGDVIRALDDGRGVDVGRTLLSHQDDAMINVTGTFTVGDDDLSHSSRPWNLSGPFYQTGSQGQMASFSTGSPASGPNAIGFDLSRVARVASEVRVKSTAYLVLIRAS